MRKNNFANSWGCREKEKMRFCFEKLSPLVANFHFYKQIRFWQEEKKKHKLEGILRCFWNYNCFGKKCFPIQRVWKKNVESIVFYSWRTKVTSSFLLLRVFAWPMKKQNTSWLFSIKDFTQKWCFEWRCSVEVSPHRFREFLSPTKKILFFTKSF